MAPTPQSVHSADPALLLNFPDTHAVHLSFVPVKPGMHKHAVTLALPAEEVEFDGHASHLEL
jgi:hypothetical protein